MGSARGGQSSEGPEPRDGDEIFPGFTDFSDEEGAPFYESSVARFRTPQATAAEVLRCFSGVVFGVMEQASRRPLRLDLDDLLRWHRATFKSTFPYQAGELRAGPTWFDVRWREDGRLRRRMVEGSDPGHIRDLVRAAFRPYNTEREARQPEQRSLREAATTAAVLYAELLRVHPFEDGNLRASFPVFTGALVSLGAPPVHFEDASPGPQAPDHRAVGRAAADAHRSRCAGGLARGTMTSMTGRCYDFDGPAEPVIATSGGWVAIDERSAASLAASAMLLACSPEHVQRLRADAHQRDMSIAALTDCA
jgi:fido (protein-threonine AMPylation protein)